MSRFRIGQDVYAHMPPPDRIAPGAMKYTCSIGTITDGPHAPGDLTRNGYWNLPSWSVEIEGKSFRVAEYLLEPVNKRDADSETSTDKAVTA